MKSIPVLLPEPIWGRMASIAEDRGVTVEDLLTSAVMQIVRPATVAEKIVTMARAGYPDKVIADHTKQVLGQVARVRRAAGIPANKFRPHHESLIGEAA